MKTDDTGIQRPDDCPKPKDNCSVTVTFNPELCEPPCSYPAQDPMVTPYPECVKPELQPVQVCDVEEPCEEKPCKPELKTEDVGCKWLPESCTPSTPPAISCAPVNPGFCQWDGGVPRWTLNCLDDCDERIANALNLKQYVQYEWDHVLDLSTHPEITSLLQVRNNGVVNPITEMQFIALAIKLARLANAYDANPEIVNENNLGLGYVKMKDGSYALSVTHKGFAVGSPLPVVVTKDDQGNIISTTLPNPQE